MFNTQNREPTYESALTSFLTTSTAFPFDLAEFETNRPYFVEVSLLDITYSPGLDGRLLSVLIDEDVLLTVPIGVDINADYEQPLRVGPITTPNATIKVDINGGLGAGQFVAINMLFSPVPIPSF